MVAVSMIVFGINLLVSLRAKEPAPANPWRSRSLEWQVSSPPPEENFPAPPVVVGGPYDYGVPESTYVQFGPAAVGGGS
jgi:cytochrome c oxidase subunit 1